MEKVALCKNPLRLLPVRLHRPLAQARKACTRSRSCITLPRPAIYHRAMSDAFPAFALSEEHEALREAVRALADDKIYEGTNQIQRMVMARQLLK